MNVSRANLRLLLLPSAAALAAIGLPNTYHDQYLAARLSEVRTAHPVPALAAAVWSHSNIAAKGVVGRRRAGYSTVAQIYDRFHIGSITKPVTSTLVAELIEKDLVPSYAIDLMDTHLHLFLIGGNYWNQYKTAPLLSYLSHVDGMPYQPTNEPPDEYASLGVTNLTARRNAYVRDAIRDQPIGAVGTKRIYAGGHIVAASMLERTTGQAWETLVKNHVFTPLGMTSAGFGPMSSTSSTTGPWEHSWNGSTYVARTWPANYSYEPHAPAGRNVHANIQDLVKFGASHLNASAGSTRILADSSINTLRTVHYQNATNEEGQVVDMTPAWLLSNRNINGANYQGFWHNGDNGYNYAWLEVLPGANLSFAIASNLGSGNSSPSGPAINAMKTHCIDVHEHYDMIGIMGRDFAGTGLASFSAGSLGSVANLNDRNFSTTATFYTAGSAAKIAFSSTKTVRKFHLSSPEGKIRKYTIDKWVVGTPLSAWIPIYTGTTAKRDQAITVTTSSATQFRLRILEATSWPVKVEELWLMSY